MLGSKRSEAAKKAWKQRWRRAFIAVPQQTARGLVRNAPEPTWRPAYRRSRYDIAGQQWVAEVIVHGLGYVEWCVWAPDEIPRRSKAYAAGWVADPDVGKRFADDEMRKAVDKANAFLCLRATSS